MAQEIQINNITGNTPFNIYLCDGLLSGCTYIVTINTFPYILEIPAPYSGYTDYCIKVIDNNDCEITKCFTN